MSTTTLNLEFQTLRFCPLPGGIIVQTPDGGVEVVTLSDLTAKVAKLCGIDAQVAVAGPTLAQSRPAVSSASSEPEASAPVAPTPPATTTGRPKRDISGKRDALVAIRGKGQFTLKDVEEDERAFEIFESASGKLSYFAKRCVEQKWLVRGERTGRGYVYTWTDAVPGPEPSPATDTEPAGKAAEPAPPIVDPEDPLAGGEDAAEAPEAAVDDFPAMAQDDGEPPVQEASSQAAETTAAPAELDDSGPEDEDEGDGDDDCPF